MDASPAGGKITASGQRAGAGLSAKRPALARHPLAGPATAHRGRHRRTARAPRLQRRVGPSRLPGAHGLGPGRLPAGESRTGGAGLLHRHGRRLRRTGGGDGPALGQPGQRRSHPPTRPVLRRGGPGRESAERSGPGPRTRVQSGDHDGRVDGARTRPGLGRFAAQTSARAHRLA
jgi:hypothetical protein